MAETALDVELVNKPLVKAWAWWALVWLTVFPFVGILVSIQFHNPEFLGGSFGRSKFRLAFTSDKEMTFTSLVDPTITETVKIAVTQLRSNLFMVAWTEKAGNRVVHVEDFEHMVIYTNIARKDGTFVRLKGPITELR